MDTLFTGAHTPLSFLWFRLLSLVSQDRTRRVGVPSPFSSGCDLLLDFPCLILMFAEALVRNVADVQGSFTFSCLSSRPADHLEACFIWENREPPGLDLSCRPFGRRLQTVPEPGPPSREGERLSPAQPGPLAVPESQRRRDRRDRVGGCGHPPGHRLQNPRDRRLQGASQVFMQEGARPRARSGHRAAVFHSLDPGLAQLRVSQGLQSRGPSCRGSDRGQPPSSTERSAEKAGGPGWPRPPTQACQEGWPTAWGSENTDPLCAEAGSPRSRVSSVGSTQGLREMTHPLVPTWRPVPPGQSSACRHLCLISRQTLLLKRTPVAGLGPTRVQEDP